MSIIYEFEVQILSNACNSDFGGSRAVRHEHESAESLYDQERDKVITTYIITQHADKHGKVDSRCSTFHPLVWE
jgi:hypothetical protein